MKRLIFTGVLLCLVLILSAQKQMLINEDFEQKMIDLKEAWTDFDMPTKVAGREARFSAYQCKYYSTASPLKPSECTKGYISIEASKNEYVPYLEFPEFPSCGLLRLGIQPGGKDLKRAVALQKLVNDNWVLVDQIDLDVVKGYKCFFWEPKNVSSKDAVKFRLVSVKSGSVLLTDVYAEQF